jgi:uncharacterized membrane protein YhaH (DUF805 family)
MGSPQVYVRFIAIKNEAEIEKGKWVALFYTLLTDTSAVAIGILGRYMLTEAGENPEMILGNAAENVLAMVLGQVMPTLIIGIYIAAVLSAVMSTVDSLLVVASSAVTRDFYQQILHPGIDEKKLMGLSKKVTLILAILALGVALAVSVLSPTRTVFWFVIFGWSGIAATFCPVIILSIFWKDYTEKGAIATMVTGFLCIPFFKFVVPNIATLEPYINKLDVMLPSVLLAILSGWATSTFLMEWYLKVVRDNYANFNGRASRQEYWMFFLFNLIILFALGFIEVLTGIFDFTIESVLVSIYQLGVVIPSIAVGVRRMHDTGKSGWFLLIPIYNLILAVSQGDSGSNKYGDASE